MYLDFIQSIIVVILIIAIIILIGGLFWAYNGSNDSQDSSTDFLTVREIITNDSHLHRLLMIEIINHNSSLNKHSQETLNFKDSKFSDETPKKNSIESKSDIGFSIIQISDSDSKDIIQRDELLSETVTFNKMAAGMSLLGKALIRSFGITIAQRIATLMHKRNEIIRDYYWSLRNVICHNGNCVHVKELSNDESTVKTIITPLVPEFIPINTSSFPSVDNSKLDITTITYRKLEAITQEITDNIASSFQIRDVDQTTKKRPLIHYQRFFNLLTMYNKELINQAKSYISHHYDISINCAQSSLELTHHISDELIILMKESLYKPKTLP